MRPAQTDTGMSRAAFWLMLRRVAVFAGTVDLVYLLVFSALGMPVMAAVNLVSMAMYASAYVLLGRRRNKAAVLLMWTEVLVHAGVSTVLLGWNTGIHYFLLVFIPAVAVSRSPRLAAGALAFLLCVYLGLDALTQWVPARYMLAPAVVVALRWLNVAMVFVMFGYTGRYYVERVAEAESRLRTLATTDPLTGLANRRHFLTMAETEVARARRFDMPLAVALVDIDLFKRVNDTHGHDAGDRVIQHVAGILRAELRSHDLVARWGGEEFIVLLPGTDLQAARVSCERIRRRVAELPCSALGLEIPVTVSIGVRAVTATEPLQDAVRAGDAALYEAKHQGRDRVVASDARGPVTPASAAAPHCPSGSPASPHRESPPPRSPSSSVPV